MLYFNSMDILKKIGDLVGSGSDVVGNVVNSATDAITDKLADMVDLENMDLSKANALIEKFNLKDKLPADEVSALADGKLSEEELKPVIAKVVEAVKSNMGMGASK